MKLIATLLLVLGVCLGALGASGFHRPYAAEDDGGALMREDYALPLFVLGLVSLSAGGLLTRSTTRSLVGTGDGVHGGRQAYRDEIAAIHAVVAELDEQRYELSGDQVQDRVGRLLAEEYFDLTRRSDDLIQLIGFQDYAQLWEGVATAERLLARCWSMCADEYPETGIEELPHARAALEASLKAFDAQQAP